MLLTNLAMLPNSGTDTPLPTTTQTYDKVEQPLLYDYGLHVSVTGTRDRETWVDKTVASGVWDYPSYTLDTIFGKTSKPGTGIIGSNPDKYFFAAYVDYSEQYHRVILLARSQTPSDKNLYSYTIHTYSQNHSTTTIKPGDSTKEQYTGPGGSKHDLIFHNYGDSFTVKLSGFTEKDEYGMLPVFDGGLLDPTYGSNTLDQNDKAAKTEPLISFWASAIPQETSTKVRYVDQATGKDIVQPMEISGFGYQGFKVKGDAPTVKGYHLVSKPDFLPSTNKASAYEDGTISPYEVGQTYDLALSDSVVIKQTVIDTNGTVRATAYYNGSRLPSTDASKVLGRESYNDKMSFGAPDGKFYTYTNRIGQVDGSYIYYYAKDSDPNGSYMRLHFIDVTGVNNSSYAPSDGPELDVDKVQPIHGNIGENYNFTYTVPKGYDQVATSDVTGTYSKTHHDAYVYVKKQAENKLYAPVASDPLTVEQGTTLTTEQAKAAVKYNGDVPSDATYAWDPKTPVDTATVGSYTPNVIVTYGDHTTSSVPVTVNVVAKTDKSNYTVTAGQPVTLTHGQQVKAGDSLDSSAVTLKDAKGQPVSLPDKAKVVWTTAPDTSEVGNGKTGQAKVVYGDKSESEPVDVTYNVVPNQADTKTPEAGKVTVNKGETPSAQSGISNNKDLPEDTKYGWKEPIDTTTPGDKTGTVVVTYPDGSSEEVSGVTVHVNSDTDLINAKAGNTPDVPRGVEIKQGDEAPAGIVVAKDKDDKDTTFPEGTQVTWETAPDVTNNGHATGKVTVTYPDKTTDTVDVMVNVVPSDADKNDVKAADGVTTNLNKVPAAKDSVKVTDPDKKPVTDFEANWTKEPDVSKQGKSTGTVEVTYPDGSKETVEVPVTVLDANGHTQADTKTPEAGKVTVNKGETPSAQSGISNNKDLPEDTKYGWKEPIDTTTPGDKTGTVVVTYPDGSSEEVSGVTVHVNSDTDLINAKAGQPVNLTHGQKVKAGDSLDSSAVTLKDAKGQTVSLPDGAKVVWATAPDTSEVGNDKTGQAKVVYGDKSESEPVTVTYNVTPNDAESYHVTAKDDVSVDKGAQVDPGSLVKVTDPAGKPVELTPGSIDWKDGAKPDLSTSGDKTGEVEVTLPDGSKTDVPVHIHVNTDKGDTTDAGNITPTVPGDKVTVKDPSHLTDDEKNQVKDNVDNANKDKFPAGTEVTVGDDGTATIKYPDGSKDTIPGDQLVQGQKGDTTDAGNITPTIPGGKVTVKDPSHLTDDEKNQVKNNVDNANKDKFPDGTKVTVGDDGTATVNYPDGSKDTIPGDQLVQGQKGDTTDAGNITPTIPGGKVTVKDPSHLTDDEKNQVKNNLDNANKDKFPAGTEVTVGDDGTTTVTYPDGSKDVIAGTDLVIAAKSEDVPGSKHHSHKNGSNSSQADRVKGASTANGSIANAGNNLAVKAETDNAFVGVKGESDNAIGNNKATSLKTLPQTGTKDTSILGVLGMLLASLGLFGFKKKRDKE